jgi:predicted dehydrogenase
MSEQRIKTAILGLNQQGRTLLEAAQSSGYFDIEAVADTDSALAEKTAANLKCTAYNDYRQMVTAMDSKLDRQNRLLLVAADMYTCEEHIRLAMKKKFNVLKLSPAARDYEEAARFVRLAENEAVHFVIANPYKYSQSYSALSNFLQAGRIEQIFLFTVYCNYGNEPYPAWQNDPKLAGGGVLLRNCYGIIDQLVCNFGIPEQVYCLRTNQAQDKRQRSYLTEDTAVVNMKFSDSFIGNIVASRRSNAGPAQEIFTIYGRNCVVTVTRTQMVVRDGSGNVIEQNEYKDDKLGCVTELLKNLALGILSPDENKLQSTGRENLNNMAVLGAAYLSAGTGFPEEPAKILQMPSSPDGKVVEI